MALTEAAELYAAVNTQDKAGAVTVELNQNRLRRAGAQGVLKRLHRRSQLESITGAEFDEGFGGNLFRTSPTLRGISSALAVTDCIGYVPPVYRCVARSMGTAIDNFLGPFAPYNNYRTKSQSQHLIA